MNKYKFIMFVACMLACISLTACGTETSTETSDTSLAITAVERSIQTTADTENTEVSEVSENLPSVPDMTANLAENTNLGHIIINGNDIPLDNTTLQDFIEATGLKICSEITVKDTDGYRFAGSIFSYGDNISDDVTRIAVEVADAEGNLVENIKADNELYDTYYIKGINISSSQTGKDFEPLFHMNIKAGMSREKIQNIYGKGTEFVTAHGSARAYVSDTWILIVHYENDTAYEITLLKK
ncbi:MAG: hypothetical protein NC548_48460 [Lachnospiraceae bacterium]|nr:hypothetical protein [Lachnospiraceae bacterium]